MMRGFSVLLAFHLMFLVYNINSVMSESKSQVYIVYMGASSPSTINGVHAELLSELNKRDNKSIVHIYHKSFLGFAARLSEEEAEIISRRPGVVSIFPDSVSQLQTTHSWDFLRSQTGLKSIASSPAFPQYNVSKCSSEKDTIIGILDTGIWPQHPSFNDIHIGSIPKRWKGICMTGDNSTLFKCNRKVIGARFYDEPDDPGSITTAMDTDGHGTHIASIAAGMPIYNASYYGLAKGVARGGSPNSRIAVYRVCGDLGCADSSVLKAFDDAIADGVDVISLSMAGTLEDIITDIVTIGAFHAVEKGVIVVSSAGNVGPSPGTVYNVSPWFLTVATTTMDRDFPVSIVLGSGNNVIIKGGGIIFPVLNKSAVYPIIEGRSAGYKKEDSTNATYCIPGSLNSIKVKGKIVLCKNNRSDHVYPKIYAMIDQGVIGIIMIDNYLRQMTFDFQITTPFIAVTEGDGAQIQSYINSKRNPLATILPTETMLNYKPAPVVPSFSSRGPALGIKNILKPDVTAPGVSILAAWRFNDTIYPDKEPPLFNLLSGTSISTPHVSGLAATIKYWHPTWKPSAIRSAIMTTAIPTNNYNIPITTFTGSKATPYDIGSGEISLSNPLCPGLVYETGTIDYIVFLCNMGYNTSMIKLMSTTLPRNYACPSNSNPDLTSNLNYPSIAVSGLMANVKKIVKRKVTNVGQDYSTYTVTVEAPAGMHVQVVPNKLRFTKNVKTLDFQVTFILATTLSEGELFGSITWSNNFHKVRSPFVVSNP